jgi:uncharacterized small protein (DUF1192 family)
MTASRARWWTHRDAARALARAEASNGTVTSTEELIYLHGFTNLLLAEVLPLAERDRDRLRGLHHELHRTLAERTVAHNGRETAEEAGA